MASGFDTMTLVALAGVLLGPSPVDPVCSCGTGDADAVYQARLCAGVEAATQELAQVMQQLDQLVNQLAHLRQRAQQLERFIALGTLLAGQATLRR